MHKGETGDWEWILDYKGELIPDTYFPKSDTVVELTESQVEQIDDRIRSSRKTSSKFLSDWTDFMSRYRIGDKFLHHCSSRKDWDEMMGTEGYAISREGFLVASIIIRMN